VALTFVLDLDGVMNDQPTCQISRLKAFRSKIVICSTRTRTNQPRVLRGR